MSVGILGYGVYLPLYRIKKEEIGKAWDTGGRGGELTVSGADEDVVTMVAEASLNALQQAGVAGPQVEAIYLASNSTPYLEHVSTGVIADLLQCGPELEVAEFAHSTGAGMAAWKAASDAVAPRREQRGPGPGGGVRPRGGRQRHGDALRRRCRRILDWAGRAPGRGRGVLHLQHWIH